MSRLIEIRNNRKGPFTPNKKKRIRMRTFCRMIFFNVIFFG